MQSWLRYSTVFFLLLGFAWNAFPRLEGAEPARPNVLFVAVDDLRPELGCYGHPLAKTPHLDALASRSVVFTRAYCQESICGPSRTSLMTGLRPDSSGVVDNDTYFRDTVPDVVTLPEHFRAHGYETVYVGKIYHGRMTDEERSWSRRAEHAPHDLGPAIGGYRLPENQETVKRRRAEVQQRWGDRVQGMASGPAFEAADVPDHAYQDGQVTRSALATLDALTESGDAGKPFFLAVGYYKPHLPLVTPKRYWDLYDPAQIELAPFDTAPHRGAPLGLHASFELRTRTGIPKKGAIDDALARKLRHAYLACVSYVDAQIGQLVEALRERNLDRDTIIMVWGDHGWHLGDHGIWGKATNYEIATRVPLMLHVPSARGNGSHCDALCELIDMYPTLCELSGLPVPSHVEGTSFAPLAADPHLPWKTAAFSQFPCPALREWAARPLSQAMRTTFFGPLIEQKESELARALGDRYDRPALEHHVMGYAIRTRDHRLVEWRDVRRPDAAPLAIELYELQRDPHETRNIAPEGRYADTVAVLREQLLAGPSAARPPKRVRSAIDWRQVDHRPCQWELHRATPRRGEQGPGLIDTRRSEQAALQGVDLASIQWRNGFWHDRVARLRHVTLPRLWELAQPWAWHNMQVAAGQKQGGARGCDWEDAWVYKWIEAASYLYAQTGDPELLEQIDHIVATVAEAQQPDGYLATQVMLRDRLRLENYRHHEVYTMGHLLTAAAIHHRITGNSTLLEVARRTADFLHREYTSGENPYIINCPLNPSVIMGAVELYRVTGERRYLELANIVVDNRGQPRPPVGRTSWGAVLGNSDLNQDAVPLREAKEVVGHAVFWSYLYAGATDVFMETGDRSLMTAMDRLWGDLVSSKMYVTGAVSPIHKGLSNRSYHLGTRTIMNDEVHEAAGLPYQLPMATAYNETCGQIGCMMWNWRMLTATGEPRFADTMETLLYNSILSGVDISGTGWSYTNPLRWYGRDHELLSNDFRRRIDPGAHQICCPTNLLRTEASWHGRLYGLREHELWVHHYGAHDAEIDIPGVGPVVLRQETQYPFDGAIRIVLESVPNDARLSVRLRIPAWATGATVTTNGQRLDKHLPAGRYVELARNWRDGDVIVLELPMRVRMLAANPRLEHTRNQTAMARGPIVYCVESTDLPVGVAIDNIRVPRDAAWRVVDCPDLLGGVKTLECEAVAVAELAPSGPLYAELPQGKGRVFTLRMIPYYAWNNRAEGEMAVWLPLD